MKTIIAALVLLISVVAGSQVYACAPINPDEGIYPCAITNPE